MLSLKVDYRFVRRPIGVGRMSFGGLSVLLIRDGEDGRSDEGRRE